MKMEHRMSFGLIQSLGEADSFARLRHSHPNMLNPQAHRCQISLAGYFHSWVHAWIQAPRKVHEQVSAVHSTTQNSLVLLSCVQPNLWSAPAVLEAAVLLQHCTGQAPVERMCSVLVWKLKTVPSGTHLVPAPWQNSSEFCFGGFQVFSG